MITYFHICRDGQQVEIPSYWYGKQFEAAENKIERWTRRYKGDTAKVRVFVEDELIDTRSPGRRAAYERWLKDV